MDTASKMSRTTERIESAFWQVLDDKGLEKLTVTDIIRVANINRSTFYNYYSDKYELMGQLQDQLIAGIEEITDANTVGGNQSHEEVCAILAKYFCELFDYIKQNSSHIQIMYKNNPETLFVSRLKYIAKEFFPYWEKIIRGRGNIKANYAYAGIMGMIASIVLEWFDSDFSLSVKEVATIASDVVQNFIFPQ